MTFQATRNSAEMLALVVPGDEGSSPGEVQLEDVAGAHHVKFFYNGHGEGWSAGFLYDLQLTGGSISGTATCYENLDPYGECYTLFAVSGDVRP